jgi:hypothetical protein
LDAIIPVLEKLFEFSCGVIKLSLILWSAGTMPTLAKSSFFGKFMFEEGRTGVSVEWSGVDWSGGPTGPLNGVIEEFYCLFNVISGFEGDIEC